MNKIVIKTISYNGRTLEFKEPVVFEVKRVTDNPLYLEVFDVKYNIFNYARSEKELRKKVEEQLWVNWDTYAEADDSVLTASALAVKKFFLSVAKETSTKPAAEESKVLNEITLNGVVYVPKDQPKPNGKRAVVVVDRGWIFAGDLVEGTDKVVLKRVMWLMRWEEIGFSGVLADPTNSKVVLKAMPTDVVIPRNSIIFTCPVHDNWGLELPV